MMSKDPYRTAPKVPAICEVCGERRGFEPWISSMCIPKGLGAWRGHTWRLVAPEQHSNDEKGPVQK